MKNSAILLTKILSLLMLLFILGCNKNKVIDPIEENELITTVKLNFTAAGTTKTFIYSDLDGDGGKPATKFESISLTTNTDYTLTIELLDESKNPAQNISEEVAKEKEEHLFVYTPSPSSLLTYTYGDKDSRNFGVGLTGNAKTGASGTGKLKVQLRHQPLIGGIAVKDGSPGPGSDDINLDFNLIIQ